QRDVLDGGEVVALCLHRDRQPGGPPRRLYAVAVAPVTPRILHVVEEDELIDPVHQVEVALPRDVAGLDDGDALAHPARAELEAATERIAKLILECRGSATDAHADLARVLGERERQLEEAAARIDQLRAELARIHGSRLWRVASVVWALRRWIGRTRR